MRFDDRLKTVMMQPVADAHDRTVRWRQLVDLLSRPHDSIDPALLDAALTMVRAGLRTVARPIRAATARSIAGRASEPRLIAIFSADRLEVAAPLLSSAQLNESGWAEVAAAASPEVSAFIRSLRGDQADSPEPGSSNVPILDAPEEHAPSISELVARIERLKARREELTPLVEKFAESPTEQAPPVGQARSPSDPMLFSWECDPSGQIGWVDGAPRGALIGRSLPGDEGADRKLVRAFSDRLPFDAASLTIASAAMEGEWRLSGIPAFSPVDGRFLGYRGIARRQGEEELELPAPRRQSALGNDAESLRETIHEIKTPLNAIIGFAEIIDGQYLGPAHRSYRHRAAEIVLQARILLSAIEDLDFAAQVQTGTAARRPPEPLRGFLAATVEALAANALERGVHLRVAPLSEDHRYLVDRDLTERLLRRLLGALINASAAEETVKVDVREDRGKCHFAVTRPQATRHLTDRQMLDPSHQLAGEDASSKLGLGFALRLVRGLVRLAGGTLRFTADQVVLAIPATKA